MKDFHPGRLKARADTARVIEHRCAIEAMRTRFECLLQGPDPGLLGAAGEAALAEVRAAERELSFFRVDSALSRLNREGASEWTRLPPRFLALLQLCQMLHRDTAGAFDPGAAFPPGLEDLEVSAARQAARFRSPGLRLDLGGIGKGEALDRAALVLRDHGVHTALLHGGTSSVLALGAPAGQRGWRVAIAHPDDAADAVASVELRDQALGVSARRGAIVDPRLGAPAAGPTRLAAAIGASAAEADAWSTALIVLGRRDFEFRALHSPARAS
jgi:thiamine biosynthesis lipoprotein